MSSRWPAPGLRFRRGRKRFASKAATSSMPTRSWVITRSPAQLAAPTPPSAPPRSLARAAVATRPPVFLRSRTIPPASPIRPTALSRSLATPPVPATQPRVACARFQHHRRSNTANGLDALASNTTGGFNTASGLVALSRNTTGSSNTANGVHSLFNNTTGSNNTASGFSALLATPPGAIIWLTVFRRS